MWKLIGRIILCIILAVILFGTGFFSYVCFKAQARKWGAGLAAIVALCVIALYWVIFMI